MADKRSWYFVATRFPGESLHRLFVKSRPPMIDSHIATFGPAEFLEFLSKGGTPGICLRVALGIGAKHADPPHPFALLRPRHDRPNRRAKPCDELAIRLNFCTLLVVWSVDTVHKSKTTE
jgi:hypothetical protein